MWVNGRALDYDQAVPDIMLSKGPQCDPEQVRFLYFEYHLILRPFNFEPRIPIISRVRVCGGQVRVGLRTCVLELRKTINLKF